MMIHLFYLTQYLNVIELRNKVEQIQGGRSSQLWGQKPYMEDSHRLNRALDTLHSVINNSPEGQAPSSHWRSMHISYVPILPSLSPQYKQAGQTNNMVLF